MSIETALIIDDSKLARVTLKKKLEAQDVEVLMSASAAEAFELLNDVQPDIVFMDHLMPEMDGFEATKQLRKLGFARPVIMCTGKEHEGYLDEALAIGANYILAKPPSDESLIDVLNMRFEPVASLDETAVMTVDDFDLDALDEAMEDVAAAPSEADVVTEVWKQWMQDQLEPLEEQVHYLTSQAISDDHLNHQLQQIKQEIEQSNQAALLEAIARVEAVEKPASIEQGDLDALREILLGEIANARQQLQKQLDDLPVSGSASSEDRELLVRLEEILHPRFIELKASLLNDVENKMQRDRESGMDELLEIRLNVLLAERMQAFEVRMQQVEKNLDDMPLTASSSSSSVSDNTNHQKFKLSEKVSKHLEQLIEENARFSQHIKQIRLLAIGAASAAGAGLIISVLNFLLS